MNFIVMRILYAKYLWILWFLFIVENVIFTFTVKSSESFLTLTFVRSSDLLDASSSILTWKRVTSVLFYYKVNVKQAISYENNLINAVEIYYLSSELLSVNKVN